MSRGVPAEFAEVRAWLFDFDNTIAALEPKVDWAASRIKLEAFLRGAGVGDRIFVEFPKGNLLLYDALRQRLLDPDRPTETSGEGLARSDPRELLREASAIIEAHELLGAEHAEPLPGAIELLRALAAHDYQVLIVTSNSSRTVERWLERFELSACVRSIIGRDTMLPLKPAPDMIRLALELRALLASDACFIGDSEADAIAASRAGVAFYGIASDAEKRDRLMARGAREVFSTPAQLAAKLASPG